MTFYDDNNDDERVEVVPELKLRVEGDDDVNGKRVNLRRRLLEECGAEERDLLLKEPALSSIWRRSIWYWIKLGFLFTLIGLLAAVFLKWVGPFFMDKVGSFFPSISCLCWIFLICAIYITLCSFH